MNLIEIVRRVQSGESTSGTAVSEVRSWAGTLQSDSDLLVNVVDEIPHLLRALQAESDPVRLANVGRVIATAASLVDVPFLKADANLYCASWLSDLEAWPLALEFATRAAQVSENEADTLEQNLRARSIAARCEHEMGRFEDTAATLDAVLAEPQLAIRLPELEVADWTLLGRTLLLLHRYDDAIAAMQTAIDHEPGSEAALFNLGEMGLAARAATQFDRAIVTFSDGRELALKLGNAERAAHFLSEVGLTWSFAGEFDRAEAVLLQAAKEAEAIGRFDDAARWRARFQGGDMPDDPDSLTASELIARATSALRHGALPREKGIQLALAAVRKTVAQKNERGEAEARNILGVLYAHGGENMRGLASLQVTITIAERLRDDQMSSRMLANAAFIAFHGGQLDQAEILLRRAVDASRRVLESDSSTEVRQAVRGGLQNAYRLLAELYGARTSPPTDRLLEIGQHARASSLTNWLAAGDAIAAAAMPELESSFLAWRRSETALEAAAISNSARLPVLLRERLETHQAFVNSARKQGFDPATHAPVLTVDEIASILRPGECVVDVLSAMSGIMLTAFGHTGMAATGFVAWNDDEREAFLTRWHRSVSPRDAARRGRRSRSAILPSGESIETLAAELHARLFSEIAHLAREVSAADHIFIVPDAHVSHFPLWSLTKELPQASVSVVPGVNALGILRARERTAGGVRVALGDVTETLRFAPREIEMLEGITRMNANKTDVIDAMRRASLAHFAGHATFNQRNPYLSGVIVERRPPRYELLTVLDLLGYARTPAAYLVVLSACETGIARLHPANEFVGLPSAFLIAGARNVIASLWKVDDRATYLLMRELYDAMASGLAPSAALAVARQRIVAMTRPEVVSKLGSAALVPAAERPYASPRFSDAFHHYGAD